MVMVPSGFKKTSRSGRKNATMADAGTSSLVTSMTAMLISISRSPSMELSSTELPIHRL